MAAGLAFCLLISSLSLQLCRSTEILDDAIDHLLLDLPASLTDDQSMDEKKLPGFRTKGISCEPGYLSDLNSVYRTGPCTLDVISDEKLEVNLKLGFKNLTFHFPTCQQFSSFQSDVMIQTFQNSVDIKVELLKDEDQGCHPSVKSITVNPYLSFDSSSLLISFGSGALRKVEAFLVKTCLRLFKFFIAKVISKVALEQSSVINNANICNMISVN